MRPAVRLIAGGMLLYASLLEAHQIKSVALNLDMLSGQEIQVSLKSPLGNDGRPAAVLPVITPACETVGDVHTQRNTRSLVRYWQWFCPGGLQARHIALEGLDITTPDGIVQINMPQGEQFIHVLDRFNPAFTFPAETAGADQQVSGIRAYFPLGVTHILFGPDHLLFVLCLLLILMLGGFGIRRLLITVTAFTLAHSLTLGSAVLGAWHLPASAVEAVIALSILLLVVEVARYRRDRVASLTFRHPEIVAFVFGLLHGFGFAGALADIGLPEGWRVWALLLFNLGVEAGQLLFVATVMVLAVAVRRYQAAFTTYALSAVVTVMGAVAAYWFIDRLLPVFTV